MRVMFDSNEFPAVIEIKQADITPCCHGDEGTTLDNPSMLYATLYLPEWDAKRDDRNLYEINGRYFLDGTKETAKSALENWQEITEKLLVHGYCKTSDFKNFEWD